MKNSYAPELIGNARKLRTNMTREERHLWYDFLKELPVVFKRQKVLGPYIVDFYCARAKLIVELDGSQHYDAEGLAADAKRDEYLRGLGLTVKRYSNADVNTRFHGVCEEIYGFIHSAGAMTSF